MRQAKARLQAAITRMGARHSHTSEIALFEDAPWGSAAEMDAVRLTRLAATVRRAARISPFYRHVLGADVDIPRSFDELSSLPITSKMDVRRSNLERAPRRLIPLRQRWRTSGTSGQPYE